MDIQNEWAPCILQVTLVGLGGDVKKTLCRVEDIPEGGATHVDVDSATGGFSLVITKYHDVVRAFHNACPHAGRRLDWAPGRFLIENDQLICAAHGAAFHLSSGTCVSGPCRGAGLQPVAICIEDRQVVLG